MGTLGWIIVIAIIAVGLYLWKRYQDVLADNQRQIEEVERSNGKGASAVAINLFEQGRKSTILDDAPVGGVLLLAEPLWGADS